MKITVEIDVFDDPEKCGNYENFCFFLANVMFLETNACSLFGLNLETDFYAVKCDQCKEAFQKEKDRTDPVKIQERIDDDFFDNNYS